MSGVFYVNPRFQQQRNQPNSGTVQRLLDENASLIQTIIEYQKRGSLAEVYEYEQLLHRNLVYLTQLAEPTVNSQQALPPPQPPSGLMINGSAPSNAVRMPNVTLGQMTGPSPRPGQPSQVQPLGVPGSVVSSQQQPQQPPPMTQQPQHPTPPPQQQQSQQQQMPQQQPPTSAQMGYRPAPPGMSPYGGQPPQPYGAGGQPGGPPMVMARQPMSHGGAMTSMNMPPNMSQGHPGAPQAMMRHQQPQFNQPPGSMYPTGPMGMGGMGMQQMGMPPGAQSGAPQSMQVPSGYQPNYPAQ